MHCSLLCTVVYYALKFTMHCSLLCTIDNIAMCSLALICFLVALPVLIQLIRHKMCKSVLQRLFLYLTAVVLIHLGVLTVGFKLKDNFDCYYWIQDYFVFWSSVTLCILLIAIALYRIGLYPYQHLEIIKLRRLETSQLKIVKNVVILIWAFFFPLAHL